MENYTMDETFQVKSSEMRDAVLPVTVFIGIEIVVGFIGNISILYVFLFKYHQCSYRYFVLSLASYDFISTLTTMPGEIIHHRYWYEYPSSVVCKVKSFCNILTVAGNGLTLLAIAIDRYRRVCRPLGWQVMPRHSRILCAIIFIIACALSAPVPIYRGLNTLEEQFNNITICITVCDNDKDYLGSDVRPRFTVSLVLILAVCLLGMLVLYSIIVKKLIVGKNKILKSRRQCAGLKAEESETCTSNITENTGNTASSYTKNKLEISNIRSLSGEAVSEVNATNEVHHTKNRAVGEKSVSSKLRKKTFVMFILSVTFFTTTALYLILIAIVMVSDNKLNTMTPTERSVYTFFLRLVFINHVVNFFIYGYLDREFRKILVNCITFFRRRKHWLL